MAVSITLGDGHSFYYQPPRCRLISKTRREGDVWSLYLHLGQCFVFLMSGEVRLGYPAEANQCPAKQKSINVQLDV